MPASLMRLAGVVSARLVSIACSQDLVLAEYFVFDEDGMPFLHWPAELRRFSRPLPQLCAFNGDRFAGLIVLTEPKVFFAKIGECFLDGVAAAIERIACACVAPDVRYQ